MQSTTTTRAGLAQLRWFGKKRYVIKALKGLRLGLIFCNTYGGITKTQGIMANKKAKRYLYILHHYNKRYTFLLKS